jgi:hypothetical protein
MFQCIVTFRVNIQFLLDQDEKWGSHKQNDIKGFTVKQSPMSIDFILVQIKFQSSDVCEITKEKQVR